MYLNNRVLFGHKKRREILIHMTTWLDHKNIMLNLAMPTKKVF